MFKLMISFLQFFLIIVMFHFRPLVMTDNSSFTFHSILNLFTGFAIAALKHCSVISKNAIADMKTGTIKYGKIFCCM